jgi:DNA sulfur modification protein DndC
MTDKVPFEIENLIEAGALFVANHSGGKDSQCMYLELTEIIPDSQLVVIHAHLPEVEWDYTIEHIEETTFHPLYVVQARKTFFEMVHHRKMFPAPKYRQCTSDLKRGPVEKQVRALLKERDIKIVVNCMGLRADESPGRAKKEVFKLKYETKNYNWYEWLPIHNYSTQDVFNRIELAGQKPFWIYAEGMKRKSCSFCIFSTDEDLKLAAELRPQLCQKYIKTEQLYNHTLTMPVKGKQRFLTEILEKNK